MSTYSCEICEKVFKQKGDYDKHTKRKTACVSLKTLKDITASGSKLNITTKLNKCLNDLRANCNVLGEDALQIISYFLIMALMESKLETMDMYNEKYYEFESDEDKKEIYDALKFSKLIKAGHEDICALSRNVWNKILSKHPLTQDIFKENNSFGVNNDEILKLLLKTIGEIDFNAIDSDILGDCYEEVVKNTLLQGDGQFFTPPFIKNIATELIDIQVYEDGTIETIFDPAMGTGGFILTCIKYIKDIGKSKNIKLNWEQITTTGLGGREVIEKTFRFAKANCLVYSGHLFKTIEMNDTIRVPVTKKYKKIVANPPYGIKGLMYSKLKHELRDEYLPIVTNMAVPLFIQAIIYMLDLEGQCAIVLPNGQELFNIGSELMNIRIFLLKTCDLKEVIYFPEKQFKKTAIKVCILHFIKKSEGGKVITIHKKMDKTEKEDTEKRSYVFTEGYNTTSVKFYNCDQKNGKVLLCEVPIDKIAKNNYSLNYSNYLQSAEVVYGDGIMVKTLGEVCNTIKGEKKQSKDGKTSGQYPLYYCSILGNLYLDTFDYTNEGIIINKTNGSGKAMVYYGSKNYNVGETTIHFCSNSEILLTKYIYYYLLNNIELLQQYYKGANQKSIVEDDLFRIKIPIPPLDQQKESVKYIDFIYEKAIKASQEKINELKSLNEGCLKMQRIFGDNKIVTLGEVCDIQNGKRIVKGCVETGDYPVLGGGGFTSFHTNEYTREGKTCKISREGMSLNNCVMILNEKYYLNSQAFTVTSINENIMSEYLWYYLDNNKSQVYNCGRGSAQKAIDIEAFKNIKIPIPSLDRQKKIVEYCDYNDTLIKQLEKEIEQNKEMVLDLITNIVKGHKNIDIVNIVSEIKEDQEINDPETDDPEVNDIAAVIMEEPDVNVIIKKPVKKNKKT